MQILTCNKDLFILLSINDRLYRTIFHGILIEILRFFSFEVPRFCYHIKLYIAGNCRMCLIEDTKSLKPVICCALETSVGLSVYTNTLRVKKARESILEFLLINHPLDCPICDQGGECDLQDLTIVYGSDRGRFYDIKRNFNDRYYGNIIKTNMNRCIHCTRCVRFSNFYLAHEMSLLGRGSLTIVGSYINKIFMNNLSGTLVDLCPVGALTSKIHAFRYRVWELCSFLSVDIFDPFLILVYLDIKNNEIIRVRPALDNLEWLTDNIRYGYDFVTKKRVNLLHLFSNKRIYYFSWYMFFYFLTVIHKFILSLFFFIKIPYRYFILLFWSNDILKIFNLFNLFFKLGVFLFKNELNYFLNKNNLILKNIKEEKIKFLIKWDFLWYQTKFYYNENKYKNYYFILWNNNSFISSINYINLGFYLKSFIRLIWGKLWLNVLLMSYFVCHIFYGWSLINQLLLNLLKNFNLKWVYSFYTINPLYFNWSDFFYLDLNINNICLFGSIIFFYNIGVLKNKFLIKKNIYNDTFLYNPMPYYYQSSHLNIRFRDYLVFFIPAAVYLEDSAVYYCINWDYNLFAKFKIILITPLLKTFINCRSHLMILIWLQYLLFKNSIFCINKKTVFFLNLNFYIKKNFFFNFWFKKLNLFILNFFSFISVAYIDRVLLSRNILVINQERRLLNSYFY